MTGVFRPIAKAGAALAVAWLSIGAAPNWMATITKTAEGHRLGNPDAKVKLITYESYTCPHCSAFEKDAAAEMRLGYIQPGKMSLEVRHYVRDPADLTAAMLTECVAPGKFFDAHRAFFVAYDKWFPLIQKATPAQRQRWNVKDGGAARRAIASDAGFYPLMAAQGLTRVQVDKCLNNEALAKTITDQRAATDAKYPRFEGTPSFVLNGMLLGWTAQWSMLRPQIEARL